MGPYRIWFFNSTFGYLVTDSTFKSGVLEGNQMLNTIFAVDLGGGARFHFTERLSMAGTFGLIYAHVDNEFKAQNATGRKIKDLATGQFVDWTVHALTLVPSAELRYTLPVGITTFEFTGFSNKEQTFTADLALFLSWKDSRLAGDSGGTSFA